MVYKQKVKISSFFYNSIIWFYNLTTKKIQFLNNFNKLKTVGTVFALFHYSHVHAILVLDQNYRSIL